MALGIGRGLGAPLLALNFCLYLITAAIAGWALNRYIDHNLGLTAAPVGGFNIVTFFFLPIALIASVVGLASTLAGIHHLSMWRTDSLAASAAAALIAWLLTLLAMGACGEGNTYRRTAVQEAGKFSTWQKVVEAFTIILAFTQLLYLLSLHAGILGGKFGPGFGNTSSTGLGTTEKTQGTPAAAAV